VVDLRWTAEAAGGVASVDLSLSRSGLDGPFETLAEDAANTGHRSWVVTGPVTMQAMLKVAARDTSLRETQDLSDAPLIIMSVPGVHLVDFEARWGGDGMILRWVFDHPEFVSSFAVERSEDIAGPWLPVTLERRDDAESAVGVDMSALRHHVYYYRVVYSIVGGSPIHVGTFRSATESVTRYALAHGGSNPASGAVTIRYDVPDETPARVSVFDLQGREIAVLAEGVHIPDRYEVTWSGESEGGRVPPGLYFVRLAARGGIAVLRVVLAP
jgi:hypothetical protein